MRESIVEIRESGLLELYVIGELNEKELKEVEVALLLYKELRNDLRQIELALYTYALANSKQVPQKL